MKKFVNAEIKELEISETAMGPQNPDEPDDAKYAVKDENGYIIGWRATFGNNGTSQQQ